MSHKRPTPDEELMASVLMFVFFVVVAILLVSYMSGCTAQSAYRDERGRWIYSTNEVLHQSNSSAQLAGPGSITVREYDRKTGSLSTDYQVTATDEDSLITVRSRPDGVAAVRLWGLLNLGSDLINGGNQIGQEAVE